MDRRVKMCALGVPTAADKVRSLSGWLAGCVVIVLMFHVVVSVLTRYLGGFPLTGVVEQTELLYMIILTFLPLAYVEQKGSLTRTELLSSRLSPQKRSILVILIFLLAAAISFVLVWYSGERAIQAFVDKEALPNLFLPVWVSRFVLPVGLSFLAIHCLVKAVSSRARRYEL